MRLTAPLAALIMVTAAGCAVSGGQPDSAIGATAADPRNSGLDFAQQHCSACHAVSAGISPNTDAPPFEAIVNTPGLSAETLRPWLRDSHNYPEIMNFEIAPEQIDALAAFMLTLRNPDYRAPIQ